MKKTVSFIATLDIVFVALLLISSQLHGAVSDVI